MGEDINFCVLGPGPGTIDDYKDFKKLLKKFSLNKKKLIGICLGHQLIADHLSYDIKKYRYPLHGVSFELELSYPFVSGDRCITQVQFYNSWFVVPKNLNYQMNVFNLHESDSICALKSDNTLSFQFHPESVGTSCPELFFEAMRLFLYNDYYDKKEN